MKIHSCIFMGKRNKISLFSLTEVTHDMYAYLEGKFTYKSPAMVYVDINGVGYETHISLNTYSSIQSLEKGKLYTWLQVKEDGHVLFGFFDRGEKEIFLQLISVSGVGAATARMMLSSLKPQEVAAAIIQGNVKLLESVKGIGRKTAERLVLELKDKVQKHTPGAEGLMPTGNNIPQDALNALIALGISKPLAEQSIQKIIRAEPGNLHLEDLIKKALKVI
ncbi:MAG: Holliday junction branch migration protein RuvA [Ferruginibacter sp.]